jgi:hypothetical protein
LTLSGIDPPVLSKTDPSVCMLTKLTHASRRA